MNFAAFDAEMYPDVVTFAAPGDGSDGHGAVAMDFGTRIVRERIYD